MSIEAMSWALNTADVKDATEVLVLLGIANHADKEGRGSRAKQVTLAGYARCSDRTVRRKLADLEERGLIVRGDQRSVEHIPEHLRPVVWDLLIPGQNDRGGRTNCPGTPDTAMTGDPGHSYDRGPRTRMSGQEPLIEPSYEPSDEKELVKARFEEFWSVYPRKAGRLKAKDIFAQKIKRFDAADIIEGARRYARDPNRDANFTAHPSTWLNRGGWMDDPLPQKPGHRDRQGDILAGELAAARAADAAGRLAISGWD